MEKGSDTKHSKQNQTSPGVSKEAPTCRFETCWEDITEIEITSIQPCPIIPDYKEPTTSRLPIIVQTPISSFCIDGWHFIEQSKTAGRSTIRCHIFHIEQHSDTELAIRKVAIRVMPQGGKCSYAELVRNTYRLYRALRDTSDDLVSFSHGGDRRGADFISRRDHNIKVILSSRLGKSLKTINKYLQHGDSLNDEATQTLVDASAPKLFFEAIQAIKEVEISEAKARQKNEVEIVEHISNQVPSWLNEFQSIGEPANPPLENHRPSEAIPSPDGFQITTNGGLCHAEERRPSQVCDGADNSPVTDPAPINEESVAIEVRRIGEALIDIAGDLQSVSPQQVEAIRTLILDLTTLLPQLAHINVSEGKL